MKHNFMSFWDMGIQSTPCIRIFILKGYNMKEGSKPNLKRPYLEGEKRVILDLVEIIVL
jgi:hypothetical protein